MKQNKVQKLIFPNCFGFDLPNAGDVNALKNRYSFSNQYADFLICQNGFESWDFKNATSQYDWLSEQLVDDSLSLTEEIKSLFSLGNNELLGTFEELSYLDYFYPIGTDPAGNIFVEVLIGAAKGFVACINHECFTLAAADFMDEIQSHYALASSEDLTHLKRSIPKAFTLDGHLKPISGLSAEVVLEFFLLYEWDFCVLTTPSFNDFINNIVTIAKGDNHFSLRVLARRNLL